MCNTVAGLVLVPPEGYMQQMLFNIFKKACMLRYCNAFLALPGGAMARAS
jgi:predicted Rossmann-fold nucleotide-binding protein